MAVVDTITLRGGPRMQPLTFVRLLSCERAFLLLHQVVQWAGGAVTEAELREAAAQEERGADFWLRLPEADEAAALLAAGAGSEAELIAAEFVAGVCGNALPAALHLYARCQFTDVTPLPATLPPAEETAQEGEEEVAVYLTARQGRA
jgi:hypothetical protein